MLRRSMLALLIMLALSIAAAVAAPLVVQAGGGCHANDGSVYAEGTGTIVKMDVCSFAPTIERVPVGTTIRFLNSADREHMVVGRSGTWASGILAPGAEYFATFNAPGTYPFSCPLHPGMVGAIVVGNGLGVSGGASVGLPAPVTEATGPSAAPSAAAPSAPAASTTAASPATAASTPATTPAHAETAIDPTLVGAAIVLAAIGGVIAGVLAAGALAARRRPEATTAR